MKTAIIKKGLILISVLALSILIPSCSYDELPPKTDDATSNYVLPKGEVPTAAEQQEVSNIRTEYNNATK